MKLQRAELKKARIEIIPMIDTIFFLLVFFMMTSLAMVQMESHKVNLPESSGAMKKPESKVVVSISKEGDLYLAKDLVTEAQLLQGLSSRIRAEPRIDVVINCDRDQKVARFVRVFDIIKQANAANVMVATAPKEPRQLPVH